MSPLPTELTDRWENRVEPRTDEGIVYWHMLLGHHPDVSEMVDRAQEKLSPFPHLHMTPRRWTHITVLTVGSTDEIKGEQMNEMLAHARQVLCCTAPIGVTIGRVLYHPQAVMLAVQPEHALHPILTAAQSATRAVVSRDGMVNGGPTTSWTPHITLCYSTGRQPAAPVISALGKALPSCDITIDAVSLVVQRGPERLWDWHSVGTVSLRGNGCTDGMATTIRCED